MSQRRAGPCGLFSRAEEKKRSDDVIEEAFTSAATVCRTLFHARRFPSPQCVFAPYTIWSKNYSVSAKESAQSLLSIKRNAAYALKRNPRPGKKIGLSRNCN